MKIEILGTGCAKCKTLYDAVQAAVNEKGIVKVALVGGWFVWQGF